MVLGTLHRMMRVFIVALSAAMASGLGPLVTTRRL